MIESLSLFPDLAPETQPENRVQLLPLQEAALTKKPKRKPVQVGLLDAMIAEEEAAEKAAAVADQAERSADPVGEKLVALGYAANEFCLTMGLNAGYRKVSEDADDNWSARDGYTYPWNLPSRAMQFPVHADRSPYWCECETCEKWGGMYEGPTHLWVEREEFLQHPYVLELLSHGFDVPVLNGLTVDRSDWYHAVDLCTTAHWKDLLATRQFTTDECIFGAVSFRTRWLAGKKTKKAETRDCLDTRQAREILGQMGSSEPKDRAERLLTVTKPSPITEGKATYYPVNMYLDAERFPSESDCAWAVIHGLEDGWFETSREGYLRWSAKGYEIRMGAIAA